MDKYDPARDVTPAFVDRVTDWFERADEVLVILRYLRAAGAKDFAFCRTRSEVEALIESVPIGTDIEVFRDRQLPIRGVVDETFIRTAFDSFPDGEEYLLMTIETELGSRISRFARIDCSQKELHELLSELIGAEVALGRCPDFNVADHDGLVSAAKGGIDGPR
ncbi:hypothetical protein [Paludisphaera mucosa]|uniref:Uncharacterized protein n=1 Tax=Paludisphaera mucosa TaxID=3030827 RepID=A0ABT6FH82_9BACT|nr:hypothetical protein [Paludisphaera mucosa]MDG3006889.1 hypothetical protein [Paludisphaera mucosa]